MSRPGGRKQAIYSLYTPNTEMESGSEYCSHSELPKSYLRSSFVKGRAKVTFGQFGMTTILGAGFHFGIWGIKTINSLFSSPGTGHLTYLGRTVWSKAI